MGLLNFESIKFAARLLAERNNIQMQDLSEVPDPLGRLDFLASKLIEAGVRTLPPEAQMTYHAARPVIDGYLAQQLAERVQVPKEVIEMVQRRMQKGTAA